MAFRVSGVDGAGSDNNVPILDDSYSSINGTVRRVLARSWYYAERLPKNLRLIVWDGWRSYELHSKLCNILLTG